MFQYTIWWTTRVSTAVGSTMWRQSQHQRHSSYARRGNFNHLPPTWRDYTYQLLLRGVTTNQLRRTMTRVSGNFYYYYKSTTNHYAETSLLLRLTTCRVHKLLLCGVPPVYFVRLQTMRFHLQLTYNHLLLQLYRTVNWYCVLILLFPFRDDVDLWCSVIPTPVMMMFPVIVSVLMMSWQSSTVIPIVWRCASLMKVPDVGYFFCRSRLW